MHWCSPLGKDACKTLLGFVMWDWVTNCRYSRLPLSTRWNRFWKTAWRTAGSPLACSAQFQRPATDSLGCTCTQYATENNGQHAGRWRNLTGQRSIRSVRHLPEKKNLLVAAVFNTPTSVWNITLIIFFVLSSVSMVTGGCYGPTASILVCALRLESHHP